jgi:succinyl-CoA synthetase alpha subunit
VSVLVGEGTRVIVQGITGREGSYHCQRMRAAGTEIVAGVTPGKAGQESHGVPVFDSVADAVASTQADTSVLFVSAPNAADAIIEAVEAGIRLVVCITEGIPVRDMTEVVQQVTRRGAALVGPNCPGVITPGRSSVGIMPADVFRPGRTGVVSRSGTLTYLIVEELSRAGIGQSTCIGIGGDPVHGLTFVDCLKLFEADEETDSIVLVGEIGGDEEELAAGFVAEQGSKPVVAYLAGFAAPAGKTMGHAGAIVTSSSGTAASKRLALEAAGIPVVRDTARVPAAVGRLLEAAP